MYDMWPFTGTEHYGVDTPQARWRSGYSASNRPHEESGLDLDRWTFQRKSKHWEHIGHMTTLVPASAWMESTVQSSALLNTWSTSKIPHVIDTNFFVPMPAQEVRRGLELPQDAPIALFLSSAGIDDPRKGWDLLQRALPAVVENYPDLHVLIVGPIPPSDRRVQVENATRARVHWMGIAESSTELRNLYNSADVVVVPSRDDNMPLTAMEAQSCGRAVVGFDRGGLPDLLRDGVTGFLAQPFNVPDLARAINDALNSSTVGQAARTHAVTSWSQEVVVTKFKRLYRGIPR
jgi:glycosyltransferase involved in cell wall biosynthesis